MNTIRNRNRTLAAAGALLAWLGLLACGGGETEASASDTSATATASAATLAPGEQISANTATEAELQTIPGVGAEIAEEIIEYRPYDVATGPDRFREEMAKYIDDAEIEEIMAYLDFSA